MTNERVKSVEIKPVRIGEKLIGPGQPCFIIAEAGVNHNGDVNRAMQLIDMAVAAKADAVKFQTFFADEIVTRDAERAPYQKKNMPEIKEQTQWEMLKALELPKESFAQLKTYCDEKGIMFFSTPYDIPSIDLLDEIGVSAFKVSSAWITNLPFLAHMAKKGKPIIFSRGMSYEDEINEAIQAMKTAGAKDKDLVLMHCHFNYPTDIKDVNLRVLATLRDKFHLPTGFSDHTPGINASLAAVALGAVAIEKHITLDKTLPGPDHVVSLDEPELNALVLGIRQVEQALGKADIDVTPREAPMRQVSRCSLAAAVDIKPGTVITAEMLKVIRPGTGIKPRHFNDLVGKITSQTIKAGTLIDAGAIKDLGKVVIGNKTQ